MGSQCDSHLDLVGQRFDLLRPTVHGRSWECLELVHTVSDEAAIAHQRGAQISDKAMSGERAGRCAHLVPARMVKVVVRRQDGRERQALLLRCGLDLVHVERIDGDGLAAARGDNVPEQFSVNTTAHTAARVAHM